MRLVSFHCRKCGHQFELIRKTFDNDSGLACPECGAKEIEKADLPFYGKNADVARGSTFRFG